jgi:hypothetical protein
MGGTWWLEDVLLLMSMLELCPLVLFLHFEHVLEPPARRHQVGRLFIAAVINNFRLCPVNFPDPRRLKRHIKSG